MNAWIVRQSKIVVIGMGVGAVFFLACRLFDYRPDLLSFFLGTFIGSLMHGLVMDWR